MAHTIEEIQKAKKQLCGEISKMLLAFEEEYGVGISSVEYERWHYYCASDNEPSAESTFEIRIEL